MMTTARLNVWLALVVLSFSSVSCLSTARHAECKDSFNLCSDTCAYECNDGPGVVPPNLAEAAPNTDASSACAQCVDRCRENRDRCDDEIDAKLASQPK